MAINEDASQSVRWWENYTVRYFVGTVVGAAIVALLNNIQGSPFHGVLFSAQQLEQISFKDVAVVGVGLAYCYVASAPVLVTHALREHLRFWRSRKPLLWPTIGLGALGVTEWIVLRYTSGAAEKWGVAVLVAVVVPQVILLVSAAIDRLDRLRSFYRRISAQRARKDDTVREYVSAVTVSDGAVFTIGDGRSG